MGWVTYWQHSGELHKYFRKEGPAKTAVTKHRREMERLSLEYKTMGLTFRVGQRVLTHCSYSDYEGVLLGLRGNELKMWQFCNSKKVDTLDR